MPPVQTTILILCAAVILIALATKNANKRINQMERDITDLMENKYNSRVSYQRSQQQKVNEIARSKLKRKQ